MTLLSRALAESEPSPEPPPMPETDAARQTTHWAGCEQAHHGCALAKLERVTAALDKSEADHEILCECYANLNGDVDMPHVVAILDDTREKLNAANEEVRALRAERDALEAACIDFLAASSEVPTVAPRLRQALDAAGIALTVRDSLREGD